MNIIETGAHYFMKEHVIIIQLYSSGRKPSPPLELSRNKRTLHENSINRQ